MLYTGCMISQLRGAIVLKDPEYLIIDVHGVGYRVYVTPETLANTPEGVEAHLWTHLSVRETAHDLYGFLSREDLNFFELLITISGVGPKSALAIMSLASTQMLTDAIAAGDTSYLTKVSGIGAKSAKKIVLELSDKVGAARSDAMRKDESEALDVLTAMGYSVKEAREALKGVPSDVVSAQERLKYALKQLA